MAYLEQSRGTLRQLPWLGAVAGLHVALIMALLNGLGTGLIPREPTRTLARIVPPEVKPAPTPPPLQDPHMVQPEMPVQRVPLPLIPRDPGAVPSPDLPAAPTMSGTNVGRPVAAGPGTAPGRGFSPLRIVGGAPAPAYPGSYEDKAGRVTVDCVIQADGTPIDCRIVAQQGGPAFANETLRWLNGPHHPVYQATMRAGQKQAEEHQWVVSFQPE